MELSPRAARNRGEYKRLSIYTIARTTSIKLHVTLQSLININDASSLCIKRLSLC